MHACLVLARVSSFARVPRQRFAGGARSSAMRVADLDDLLEASRTAIVAELKVPMRDHQLVKEGAVEWQRERPHWRVFNWHHVPDDPIERGLRGEVFGYLVSATSNSTRVTLSTSYAGKDGEDSRREELLGLLEDLSRMAGSDVPVDVEPVVNDFATLFERDGEGRVVEDWTQELAKLRDRSGSAAAADRDTVFDSEDMYSRMHAGDTFSKSRTAGQLRRFYEGFEASKKAVESDEGRRWRARGFGPGPVTVMQTFQMDWTKKSLVLGGAEALARFVKEKTESSSSHAARVLASKRSPSMLKLQEDYASIEEALSGFLAQQGELLETLQPYRAEVMPVRHFYQDLGPTLPMPLARYLVGGRALPTVLVDMREEVSPREVWQTARRFGLRGVLLSQASARQLLPDSLQNVFTVACLDAEESAPVAAPRVDAVLLNVRLPAGFHLSDGEDEVTAADRLLGDYGEWKDRLTQRIQAGLASSTKSDVLMGICVAQGEDADHAGPGDRKAEGRAAVLTRAAALAFAECSAQVQLVMTERSVGRRFENVWEVAESLGAVVICTNAAPSTVTEDPLLQQAVAGKLSITPLQCVTRYHSYEGDLVALSPPNAEGCSAWAEELCKVAGTDLRPEHIVAMGSMEY